MKEILREVRSRPGLGIFLDYDGTLVPIRPEPRLARLSPGRRAVLETLARECPIAVVSGRSLEDVRALVGIPGIVYAGNHGLEIMDGPRLWVHPRARASVPRLNRAVEAVRRRIGDIPGALIENKGLTASIHVRLSPPSAARKVRRVLDEVIGAEGDALKLTRGRRVFEIRPAVDWDKGRAVQKIARGFRNKGSSGVLYIGDDRTDEDAFRALGAEGITIRVGGISPTRARYRLKDVDGVWTLLRALRGGTTGKGRGAPSSGPRLSIPPEMGKDPDIMRAMDIFLTEGAFRTLEAHRLASGGRRLLGFLLGHERGGRVYVEETHLWPGRMWPALGDFQRLQERLGGRIVGFFVLGRSAAAGKALLQPHAVGKVLIEAEGRAGRTLVPRGIVIDYEEGFRFVPADVLVETPAAPPAGEEP